MSVAAETEVLRRAVEHCRAVCRRRARNFYYGLKLAPEPQRSALYVVYAWMRMADDLVDGDGTGNRAAIVERVHEFRTASIAAVDGKPSGDESLWIALADTASRFHLPREHFLAMIDGQVDDLDQREYQTFEELHRYCYRVASTVGLLCVEIWGYDDPKAKALAIDRGIAFQLTNILRDFKEDFDGGRVYLPREEFKRKGISPAGLREWNKPGACVEFMQEQIARAEEYYGRSSGLEEMISLSCRPTLWAMTSIYHGLLEKMASDPARIVGERRLRLSTWRKGMIAAKAKWQVRKLSGGNGVSVASGNIAT